jgi:exopolysaccharide transport family protein
MAAPDNRPAKLDHSGGGTGPYSSGALIDVHGFLQFVRRRALLIAAVTAAAVALGIVALAVMQPRFTASAMLLLDPRQEHVVSSQAVLPGIGSDAAAVESQVEVISSTSVAQSVIEKLHLGDDPEFTRPSLGQQLAALFAVRASSRDTDPDVAGREVIKRFQDRLKVQRRGLTYVVGVEFTAESADKSARIANAVAASYLSDQAGAKREATMLASRWLNDRLDELRERVTTAERAVAAFKTSHNIVETGEGRTLTDRQFAELNQQLVLARARTAEARAQYEQVSKTSATAPGGLPQALLSPVVGALRTQYAQLTRSEAELTGNYGPRHPALATIRAQLADVRREIEREIGRIAAGLRNDFEAAQSREHSLDASLARLKAERGTTDEASVRLRELEREAQASRTLLEQFLLRAKETGEQQSLERADARVISPALPPLRPSAPRASLVLAMSLAGGLVLGFGAAAIAETLSRGFRSAHHVTETLDLPVLGALPENPGPGWFKRAGRRRVGRDLSRLGSDGPGSAFGEAVRSVRLRLASRLDGSAGVLLVASALPGEGKSTLAANLAHAFAKAGTRTLLVDADVRNPTLTRFGARGTPGLLDVLRGERKLEEVLGTDADTGCSFLPLGRAPDASAGAELVTNAGMQTLVAELREQFPVVVIDGPPLLPFADAGRMLEFCDAALMVVMWAATDRDHAAAALDSLGPQERKVVGVVLNKVDLRSYRAYEYG